MPKYLGEFPVKLEKSPFKGYTVTHWAMHYIAMYASIDGAHHKQWLLNQIARILKGTPVIVTEARWASGEKEFRFNTGDPTEAYKKWAKEEEIEEDDEGVAP